MEDYLVDTSYAMQITCQWLVLSPVDANDGDRVTHHKQHIDWICGALIRKGGRDGDRPTRTRTDLYMQTWVDDVDELRNICVAK